MNLFVLPLRRMVTIARLGWLWVRDRRTRGALFHIAHVADEPDYLSPRTVYVIRDAGQDWAAVMSCPGGCGKVLYMTLIPDSKPVWKLTEHPGGTLSLSRPRSGAIKAMAATSGSDMAAFTGVEHTVVVAFRT